MDEPGHIRRYPRPAVAVDLTIFTLRDADLQLLLIKRKRPPFEGCWALPGGFVRVSDEQDQGEDLDQAAERELAEETGLPTGAVFLEQVRAFGQAGRDPRLRVISVAYMALVRPELAPVVCAGGDAADARWFSTAHLEQQPLAFDHHQIINAATEHLRRAIRTTDLAFELVPETFTVAELRAVYEVLEGARLDPGNFRRRFMRMVDDGVLQESPGKRATGSRKARLYRFKPRQT